MDIKTIGRNFTHHSPRPDQVDRYEVIRSEARGLAETIVGMCPQSREQSLAITKLEECVMWANASIARNEGGEPDA